MSFTYAGQYGPIEAANVLGSPLKGVAFTIYNTGTTTKATLYTDRTKGTTAPNPGATDAEGNLTFYAAPGIYDILCNKVTLTVTVYPDPADLVDNDVAGSTATQFVLSPIAATGPATVSATPGQYIIAATAGGAVTVNLPATPADLTTIGVIADGGGNTVTIAPGAGDTLSTAFFASSSSVNVRAHEAIVLEYHSGNWYPVSDSYIQSSSWAGTTEGDTVYHHAGVQTRLAIGPAGSILSSNGTDPVWGLGSVNTVTGTAYTLQAADAGCVVQTTNSSPVTITIPLSVFSAGTQIVILQGGTGPVTVVCTGGTLTGVTQMNTKPGTIILQLTGTNTWYGVGTRSDPVNVVAASGASQTLQAGVMNKITLTANCTLTLPAAVAGTSFTASLIQDGTGSRTITITSANYGLAGTPAWSTAANKKDTIVGYCDDGATWDVILCGTGF